MVLVFSIRAFYIPRNCFFTFLLPLTSLLPVPKCQFFVLVSRTSPVSVLWDPPIPILFSPGPTWWTLVDPPGGCSFSAKNIIKSPSPFPPQWVGFVVTGTCKYHVCRFRSCRNFLLLRWWRNPPLSPVDISVSLQVMVSIPLLPCL